MLKLCKYSYRKWIFLWIGLILLNPFPQTVKGENPGNAKKYAISGFVKDQTSGAVLTGVTVYISELRQGVVSNEYGFYSLNAIPGRYTIRFSHIGYKPQEKSVLLDQDITAGIFLQPLSEEIGEVVVTGRSNTQNIAAPEMSLVKVDQETIRKIPAFLGEIDLIKVIQLMPGVQPTSEGSTGFSVRGGNADQNLIILDDATVYNASHLMGFFSVFNNDVIREVTLYKGDIPAAYGGRLSSLLDVKMREGDSKKYAVTGSIGTVSSKLTIEGPLKREKTTALISGRRTYADLFLPFAKNEDIRDNKLYFYDLNLKLSHTFNGKNRIFLSGYTGRDIFKNQYAFTGFGNQTLSFRWNHLFSGKLFLNLNLLYSQYSYEIGTPEGDASSFKWTSRLRDHAIRFDFTHYLSVNHTLRFGAASVYHSFFPGTVRGLGDQSLFRDYILPSEYALDHSFYFSDEFSIADRLTVKGGLRLAVFQNTGPGLYYNYDDNYNALDSIKADKGDIFNTYARLEPRVAFTWLTGGMSSVKGSYSHTAQFLMLAQNSTAGTPLDLWFPATPNVKPQICDQFAIGYFHNTNQNKFELSAEIYYKNYKKVIDFRDHAQLLLNQFLEGELRIGKGNSYGFEALIRKNTGRLTGWLSYTWSRSFRTIPEVNNGIRYPAPFDKPHNINLIVHYDLTKRLSFSSTWVYATGLPVTFPTGKALIGNVTLPVYSDRNAYRLEDYHRLDVSLMLRGKNKPGKKWHGEWNLSVYNAYDRHNTWSVNFVQDEKNPNLTYAEKTYLFSVIPALTYNFKF